MSPAPRPTALLLGLLAPLAAQAGEWQQHISEEDGAVAVCSDGLMDGIHCTGRYCDNISIRCAQVPGIGRTGNWTPWHSEENTPIVCPESYFVSKLKCRGDYCDDISVQCSEFIGEVGECVWAGNGAFVSEENGGRLTVDTADTFVRGIKCSGRYCDNKQLLVCPTETSRIERIARGWKLVDDCAGEDCELTRTITLGLSEQQAKTRTDSWKAGVTMSLEATLGGPATGGSVKSGISTSFSQSQSNAIQEALSQSTTVASGASCGRKGKGEIKAVYQFQWEVYECPDASCAPTVIGGVHTVCVTDPPGGAANYRPQCQPGCCKNGLCDECHTEGVCATE